MGGNVSPITIKTSTIYNCDCMELMKQYPDKHFDLAIVDPPYGIHDKLSTSDKKQNKGNLDLGEEKLDENLFIEKKILNLVEKYTSPKMSKREFLSILEASETKEKPDVKEKPGTKTPPREKPHDPFKPAPHKQPKPKAKKSEVDEDTVMDAPA